MNIKSKIKVHLWTLPRWFAAIFFLSSILTGSIVAGGINLNAWIAVIAGMLIMGGGHIFNSSLDYAVGLDKGEKEDRSAEKFYTGGQNIIECKIVSEREVWIAGTVWYLLALIPLVWLAYHSSFIILIVGVIGMSVPIFYTFGKFSYYHELALAVGVGPAAALIGAYAVNPNPPILNVVLVSIPATIILSFAGLALDEAPDYLANLKKGVKSIAYKVSQSGIGVEWYCSSWLIFMMIFQVLLITIGILKPLTAISFIPGALMIPSMVVLRMNFEKGMRIILILGGLFLVLLLIGQVYA